MRRRYRIRTLDVDKVAWLLGTDNKTVQRWVYSGIIRPYRTTLCGDILFRRGDVAYLLARLGA